MCVRRSASRLSSSSNGPKTNSLICFVHFYSNFPYIFAPSFRQHYEHYLFRSSRNCFVVCRLLWTSHIPFEKRSNSATGHITLFIHDLVQTFASNWVWLFGHDFDPSPENAHHWTGLTDCSSKFRADFHSLLNSISKRVLLIFLDSKLLWIAHLPSECYPCFLNFKNFFE